ncbi:MAG TPA: DNA polymerase ligase N-terminal domain-containing protein [Candidatus Limnocylindrales bacterium]|nr:DNA polymerase ligase N-terminal domain-containing protein [Candidatus Limnocylindrales bacterium]
MALDTYRRKRRFDTTPEPEGSVVRQAAPDGRALDGGRYVVQRHRATRLHYDVRLELGGVLVSWAVPRGPSLDPQQRRLAIHVEDHPIEYFDFEGRIPARQYGGGDVIVWDWGFWSADASNPDATEALQRGELKFHLDGDRLHGAFVFLRMRWTDAPKDQWLLIHRKDRHASAGWDAEDLPESVKTGRTNDEVAAGARPKRRAARPDAAVA